MFPGDRGSVWKMGSPGDDGRNTCTTPRVYLMVMATSSTFYIFSYSLKKEILVSKHVFTTKHWRKLPSDPRVLSGEKARSRQPCSVSAAGEWEEVAGREGNRALAAPVAGPLRGRRWTSALSS